MMKKRIIFIVFAIGMAMASCNQNDFFPESMNNLNLKTETESLLQDSHFRSRDYFVHPSDLEEYVLLRTLQAKHDGTDLVEKEISPIGLNENDTLAYIINYNEGWEIIAADKRAPIVLGFSDQGSFCFDNYPENIQAWLQCVLTDVNNLKKIDPNSLNEKDDFSKSISSSLALWLSITNAVHPSQETTRSGEDGYWELFDSYYENVYQINVGRLTMTNFTQSSPYNNICPKKSWINSTRAVAGCVAIAGAQMLYYLHNNLNCPVNAASAGYCNTYISATPNYPGVTITAHNSTVWNTMISNPSTAAYLVGDVGKKVFMNYGMQSSLAYTADLKPYVFEPEGISCKYEDYMVDSLQSSICRGMPAIVQAADANAGGHAFIIDGFRKYRREYVNVYHWHYYDTGTHIEVEDSVSRTIVSNVQEVHMNWGWGENYNNSWYSATGNWNPNSLNFSNGRKMLWDFKLAN